MAQSISALKKRISKQPDNTALLGALADAYREAGRLAFAIDTYTHLIQLEPYNYQALNNLGALQRSTGQIDSSLSTLLEANKLLPNSPIILTNLANTFLSRGRSDLAIKYLEHALKIQPDFFDSHELLGNAYVAAGKYNEAIASYKQALKIKPKEKLIIMSIARTYHLLGDNERAYITLKPILKPPEAGCAIILLNISKYINRQKEAIEYFHKVLKNNKNKETPPYSSLYFCIGKYYNDAELYEKAITFYHQANKNCNRQFDINETKNAFKAIINAFPSKTTESNKLGSIQTSKPIFIIGMPRSGTSLVEQIISSHPDVFGAGELNNIHVSAEEAKDINGEKFPLSIANLTTKELDKLAQEYLEYINSLSNNEKKVTDKMPHNFMYIGFILKLFPSAKIIHCKRHPLDTTLSCYFAEFGNNGHDYSYNLTNLGKYYLEYHRLMQHWLNIYRENIHDIYYEELITNTTSTCKELIAYCDLDWDEKCLHFHKTKRNVHTLSYDQVNKPIYSQSMYRWKHYEKYLKNLVKTLSNISQDYESHLTHTDLDK